MANDGGVTINQMTYGFSSAGTDDLLATIKTDLLLTAKTALENVDGVVNAINAGWTGQAKDKFLLNFGAAHVKIASDLQSEYNDLYTRFTELASAYKEQDANLIKFLDY